MLVVLIYLGKSLYANDRHGSGSGSGRGRDIMVLRFPLLTVLSLFVPRSPHSRFSRVEADSWKSDVGVRR